MQRTIGWNWISAAGAIEAVQVLEVLMFWGWEDDPGQVPMWSAAGACFSSLSLRSLYRTRHSKKRLSSRVSTKAMLSENGRFSIVSGDVVVVRVLKRVVEAK
jgi:hypothetical protein